MNIRFSQLKTSSLQYYVNFDIYHYNMYLINDYRYINVMVIPTGKLNTVTWINQFYQV